MDYDLTIDEEYLEKLAEPYKVPAICLILVDEDDPEALPGCWIGGQPRMPDHIEWPHRKADGTDGLVPMYFIAQIDMAQIPRVKGFEHMPEKGNLLFFHLPTMADRQAEVIYIEEDLSQLSKTDRPCEPDDFKQQYIFFYEEGVSELNFSKFKAIDILRYYGYGHPVYDDFEDPDELDQLTDFVFSRHRLIKLKIKQENNLSNDCASHGILGSFQNFSYFFDEEYNEVTRLLHLDFSQFLGLKQSIQFMISNDDIKNKKYNRVCYSEGEGL